MGFNPSKSTISTFVESVNGKYSTFCTSSAPKLKKDNRIEYNIAIFKNKHKALKKV
jgi:hypothetical protein